MSDCQVLFKETLKTLFGKHCIYPDGRFPFPALLPLLPEIAAGLTVAGEAITGFFTGASVGTAIGVTALSGGRANPVYFIPAEGMTVAFHLASQEQKRLDQNRIEGKAREAKTPSSSKFLTSWYNIKQSQTAIKLQGENHLGNIRIVINDEQSAKV